MFKLASFGRLIILMLAAFVVNSFIYFSFINSYSSSIFNIQNFEQQFHSGVYQYRVLSAYFFFWIYDFLGTQNIDYQVLKLKFLSSDFQPQVYLAFYVLNTFFLLASTLVLHLILESKHFIMSASEKILLILLFIFIIAVSQFVVVPYDVSSYFFLLLFFLFMLKFLQKRKTWQLVLLSLIIIISTFNRETAALSISAAAVLLFNTYGISKKSILPLFLFIISFVGVYVGLRYFNTSFITNDGNLLTQNFSDIKNMAGLFFWVVFFLISLFAAKRIENKKAILLFHVFALPYLVMCFYVGILYEIRLYIPLLLVSFLLANISINMRGENLKYNY